MFGAVLAPRGTCCVFHFQCDFVPVLLRLHTMTPQTLVESPLLMTLFQCQCDHCCDNGVVCPQLSCWRAHPAGISSVRCAEVGGEEGHEQDLLLVASQDCTVSLWSLQGGLVGVLGKHTWSLSNSATWQDAKVCKHAVHAVYTPACLYTYCVGCLSYVYVVAVPYMCLIFGLGVRTFDFQNNNILHYN